MTRLDKTKTFNIGPNAKIGISFVYRKKPISKNQTFNVCYQISEIIEKGLSIKEHEIIGFELAQFFQEEILEKFLLRYQLSTIEYSEIRLTFQKSDGVDSYSLPITPLLRGLSDTGREYSTGIYKCTCKTGKNRILIFKLLDFSLPRDLLQSDIFMNSLIPEVGQTKDFNFESKGKTVTLKTFFAGKTINTPPDSICSFYETLEQD